MNWFQRLFTRSAPESGMAYSNLKWPAVPSSPNPSPENHPLARARAENEVRNGALARKIASAWSGATVGGSGISPMFRDASLRRRWESWTRSCDAAGRLDWIGLQIQIVETLVVSGECFVQLLIDESAAEVPLSLLCLGPEYLDNSRDNGRDTVSGIRFNGVKREGYWLYKHHPGVPGIDLDSVFVPAADCLHIFRPSRPGVQRGESWLTPVLYLLRLLKEYTEADLTRAKTQSLFCGFTLSDTGVNPLANVANGLGMEPGSMIGLPPGVSGVEFTNPTDHGTAFDPFMRHIMRQIASGVNIPYEILCGDLSQITFASGKAGLLEWRRQVESIQFGLLVPQFCQPVLARWLQLAEALQLTDGAVAYPRWAAPTLQALDRRTEVQSTVAAIRAGLETRREAVESQGWQIEDIDAELAADQARADRLGLILDSDARQRTQQGQQQQPIVSQEELS